MNSATWMDSLLEQGFPSPIIKEVSTDSKKLWFISDGADYVGNIMSNGNIFVEKATFAYSDNKPSASYAPTQTNKKRLEQENVQGEPYTGDVIEDSEDI